MNLKSFLGFQLMTLLSLIGIFIMEGQCFAWDKTGHRVVGQIAQNHLTSSAQKKVKDLLNGESLAQVSVWADEIRSDSRWNFVAPWHYVNFPIDGDYENSPKNPAGDIIVKIQDMVKILKTPDKALQGDQGDQGDPGDQGEKLTKTQALKLLVHFMGDLHQPLHVGFESDRGGNDISVLWFKEKTNLHVVWDQHLVDFQKLSFMEWVQFLDIPEKTNSLQDNKGKDLLKTKIINWAMESRELLKSIYSQSPQGAQLGYPYTYEFNPIIQKRLTQAGLRLAEVLNDVF